MATRYGYREEQTVKVIRRRHTVCYGDGITACVFKKALAKVPDAARLVDVESNEDGDPVLIFEEEKLQGTE